MPAHVGLYSYSASKDNTMLLTWAFLLRESYVIYIYIYIYICVCVCVCVLNSNSETNVILDIIEPALLL